jgi:hypothetical protein
MTTPTDAEIIFEAIDSRMLDVHTAIPCIVESYDNSTQTADLQPQVKRAMKDGNGNIVSESLPILPDVPIAFPRSSAFFISFPISKGDFVLCLFSEASIDAWRSQGSEIAPGDARRHSLTGGIGIPCCYPNSGALSDTSGSNMVIGQDGANNQVVFTSTQVQVGKGATKKAARDGDDVAEDTTMGTWITAVTGYINGLAPGTVVRPTDFGVIDEGSDTVRIRD